jgi:hypothetical protein
MAAFNSQIENLYNPYDSTCNTIESTTPLRKLSEHPFFYEEGRFKHSFKEKSAMPLNHHVSFSWKREGGFRAACEAKDGWV